MRSIAVSLLFFIAACQDPAREAAAPAPAQQPPEPKVETTPERPSFLGPWAASPDLCNQYPWTFEAAQLDTPGEVFCRYAQTELTADGYVLHGECSGEAAVEPDQIRLRFEGPDAMVVLGKVWGDPIRLVRCPTPSTD